MLILSKFRDYYDYLAGLGIDKKIVYRRHTEYSYGNGPFIPGRFTKILPKKNFWHEVYVCGEMIKLEYKDGKWQRHIEDPKENKWREFRNWMSRFDKPKVPINELYDCPVVMVVYHENTTCKTIVKNPNLSDYDFGGIMSAEDIYTKIYNFVSRVADKPDTRTDEEKIVSNGFDLKDSFRKV